jgi:hypothetical protein
MKIEIKTFSGQVPNIPIYDSCHLLLSDILVQFLLQPGGAIAICVKIYLCISVPYVVHVWYFSNMPTFDCHTIVL